MGLRLQQRDLRKIKAINDCHALQIEHIALMFYTSLSRAYDRVAKLLTHGYIDCLYVAQVSTSPVGSQRVFVTSKLGAQVLIENFGYDINDINFPSRREKNWQSLKHLLAINDIRSQVVFECGQSSTYELLSWHDETYFRARNFGITVDGKEKPLYPDGYCKIQLGHGIAHYFIEADNGTEGHKQFRSQIEIYEAYTKSGQYQHDFNTSALRVLIVTTSDRRLKNLSRSIEKVSEGNMYLLTTYERLQKGDVFTKAIWTSPSGGKPVSLS